MLRRGALSVRTDTRAVAVTLVLTAAALATAVVLVGSGDYPMGAADVLRTLSGEGTAAEGFIVFDLRLPRALVALLVGAALGTAGAVFQAVSRNPLGSPDILGFGYGSAVGALTVIVVFGGGATAVSLGAAAGGLLTGIAVYLLSWRQGIQGYRLVLVGIGLAAMLGSVTHYLLTRAETDESARAVLWLTGSLNGRDWQHLWPLLLGCALLLPTVAAQARPLALLEHGDDAARALGVTAERTRLILLAAAVLLTAAATAAAGPIAFVALTAPQLARRLTRTPGPQPLPAAAMGALLTALADLAAQRALPGTQLPVGAVTGVLGGCYLLWLLSTERKAGRI